MNVSILIPTRNRPELAALAVEAALQATADGCEIVVADNGDAPLDLPRHARLRHMPPGPNVLSMRDNWERALEAARGEWLMLLADKYMLVPGAVSALQRRLAARPGLRVVTYGYGVLRQALPPANDRDPAALRRAGGELRWPAGHAETAVIDAGPAFDALYAQAVYPARRPMLYTALVHRDVVAAGRRRGERYFVGPCPDVASAAQILAACDAYLDTQIPAVMVQYPSGDPRWSTGTAKLAGAEAGRRFFDELRGLYGRDPIGRLVCGVILETLTAFAAARPDLGGRTRVSWVEFAKQASREIESLPFLKRPALHLRLLAYTHRRGAPPGAAYAQFRTALASHLPRRALEPLLAWRRRLFASAPPPDAAPRIAAARVAGRDEALRLLSELVARA